MLRFLVRPLECLDRWALRYGDPFTLGRRSAHPWVFFGAPEAVEAILRAEPGTFQDPRQGDRVLRFLFGENSLLRLAGDAHRQERRRLMPHFQMSSLLRRQETIVTVTRRAMDDWQEGRPIAVREFTQDLTLRVMTTVLFGDDETERIGIIRSRLASMVEMISPLSTTLALAFLPQGPGGGLNPWHRLERHRDALNAVIYAEIHEHRRRGPRPDNGIVDAMLEGAPDQEPHQSDRAIRDEVMTLLFAGHETTASALAWALYFVQANPAVRRRLLAELDTLGAEASADQFMALPYLSAVIQETLRHYPGPIATPRTLLKHHHIGGIDLPAGTVVVPCVHLTHHNGSIYPNPNAFQPERFLARRLPPSEYWPFGDGHRQCIGMALALMELRLGVATVLTHWELAPVAGPRPRAVRRGGLVSPPPSLRLTPIRRRTQTSGSPSPVGVGLA